MTKWRVSPFVWIFVAVMLWQGQGFTLASYAVSVAMHEMAHAEVARRRGYTLTEIKWMPYGASLTGEFEAMGWRDETAVALAGPFCNVILAIFTTAVWWLIPQTYFFTEQFVLSNVFTALTNLLPVFPLDGGRALLAILSRRRPRQRAYRTVRALGYAAVALFAVLFALSVFHGINFTFATMAFFVLGGTLIPDKRSQYQRLYGMAYRSEKLRRGLQVREIMVADTMTLSELSRMLNANYYVRFVVVNERFETVGVLTETMYETLLAAYASDTKVCQLPQTVFANFAK